MIRLPILSFLNLPSSNVASFAPYSISPNRDPSKSMTSSFATSARFSMFFGGCTVLCLLGSDTIGYQHLSAHTNHFLQTIRLVHILIYILEGIPFISKQFSCGFGGDALFFLYLWALCSFFVVSSGISE